ncbi:MAG: hypothetical protein ABSD29_15280 [Verrucomicrobiota bacterium]|jgi:hypothetical protein
MKPQVKVLIAISMLALAASGQAAISLNNNSLGSATSFPTYSISGNNGTLFFQDTLSTPSGATLQGGASQGYTANQGFGEIFNYTGPSGATLSAISIIDTGGGGTATFQPFLFDLGSGIYNAGSSQFNPSIQVNLISTPTLTPPALGSANFLEFDFSGADAISLNSGDSYAFGLLNNNNNTGMTFLRSSGTQSDPNGDGFTLTSLSATSDNASPFSSAVRTLFVGVYTIAAVPEPSLFALGGLGLAMLLILRRRGS